MSSGGTVDAGREPSFDGEQKHLETDGNNRIETGNKCKSIGQQHNYRYVLS